jgi:hypothetical protein
MLAIRGPQPEPERRYVASLNHAVTSLQAALERLDAIAGTLPNRDLDTGNLVIPGSYRLTDQTYAQLLARITRHPSNGIPAGLARDLLAYYADPAAPISTRSNAAAWARVQLELGILRGMATRPEPI